MKTPLTIFALLLIMLLSSGVRAQNSYPVLSTFVETACVTNCLDADSIPYVSDSTGIAVTMTVQLFEVTGISSLHVKLGSTNGAADLLDKVFDFDVSGNVGNGCTYSRTDYKVTLGLGTFNGLTGYFSQLILLRADQSQTDAIVYNN